MPREVGAGLLLALIVAGGAGCEASPSPLQLLLTRPTRTDTLYGPWVVIEGLVSGAEQAGEAEIERVTLQFARDPETEAPNLAGEVGRLRVVAAYPASVELDAMITVRAQVRDGRVAEATVDFATAHLSGMGMLDRTFGVGGVAVTDDSLVANEARAVAVQPDGRILAAGSTGPDGALLLVRHQPDGALDPAFSGGRVKIDLAGGGSFGGLALLPSGAIIVGATAAGQPVVFRCRADGALDPGFGDQGRMALPDDLDLQAVAAEPNGAVLLAGARGDTFVVVRVGADGQRDAAFGTGGQAAVDVGAPAAVAAIVVQPNGKIVVAGSRGAAGSRDLVAARLYPDGALDPTYGVAGVAAHDLGRDEAIHAALLVPTGIALAGAAADPAGASDLLVVRLNEFGALDPAFGARGARAFHHDAVDVGTSLAPLADGSLVVGGYTEDAEGARRFLLIRVAVRPDLASPDGSEAAWFVPGAEAGLPPQLGAESHDAVFGLAVEAAGKVVAAGTTWTEAGGLDFATVRFCQDAPCR